MYESRVAHVAQGALLRNEAACLVSGAVTRDICGARPPCPAAMWGCCCGCVWVAGAAMWLYPPFAIYLYQAMPTEGEKRSTGRSVPRGQERG